MAAAAYCGLSEGEFWRTCPAYLHARIQAKKAEEKADAEFTRIIAYYAAHSGRIKPTPNIRKFWPLPWDKVTKIAEVDLEAAKPMLDAMDRAIMERRKQRQLKRNGTN